MTAPNFAKVLRETADALGVLPRQEVAALLRRAALLIENVGATPKFEPLWEAALMGIADEVGMSRDETLSMILRDWLIGHGRMPLHEIEEDSEVAGNA